MRSSRPVPISVMGRTAPPQRLSRAALPDPWTYQGTRVLRGRPKATALSTSRAESGGGGERLLDQACLLTPER
eukprot:10393331-Alexandrium_andersonii.AAC.1